VEVDLEVGLPEAIKLTAADWTHIQELDYESYPSNAGTAMATATSQDTAKKRTQKRVRSESRPMDHSAENRDNKT
jgi:hypothetical protein